MEEEFFSQSTSRGALLFQETKFESSENSKTYTSPINMFNPNLTNIPFWNNSKVKNETAGSSFKIFSTKQLKVYLILTSKSNRVYINISQGDVYYYLNTYTI